MTPRDVLIVEWDDGVAARLADAFHAAGYTTHVAVTPTDALVQAGQRIPDVIVTRWDMSTAEPDAFVRSTQRLGSLPVIAVGDHSDTEKVLAAFDSGVSAFVSPDTAPATVVARASALLRLVGPRLATEVVVLDPERQLVFDGALGHVVPGGQVVGLTATEYALLCEFVADAGRVLTRPELVARVWPHDRSFAPRLVDAHVSRLRAKIEDDADHPLLVQTVWGRGYRLAVGGVRTVGGPRNRSVGLRTYPSTLRH